MTARGGALRIVRDEEPRWTEKTPPMKLPLRRTAKAPDDHVIMNPALVAWLEREIEHG